jgi:hypothetical protein
MGRLTLGGSTCLCYRPSVSELKTAPLWKEELLAWEDVFLSIRVASYIYRRKQLVHELHCRLYASIVATALVRACMCVQSLTAKQGSHNTDDRHSQAHSCEGVEESMS